MLIELLLQSLDPSQVLTSLLVALGSIALRQVGAVFLPAILSFLANLAVLIILFIIFILSIFTLATLPPLP